MQIPCFRASRAILFAAIGAFAIAATGLCARAQDAPQTLILFDASGSMWGKLKGGSEPKFEAATSELISAMGTHINAQSQPGLIVFGGNCSRAPLMVDAKTGTVEQIAQIISRLNPKGKGPLSLALDTAAASLPSGIKSSVVLIHDGPDNCRRDPCEAAKAFALKHPGVPVHLVSIGLPKVARIATACVAKLTGGSVAQVETIEQLNAALDKAVSQSMRPPAIQEDEKTAAQTQGGGDDPGLLPSKTGPARLALSARLGAGGKPMKSPIRWRVFHGDKANDVPIVDVSEARLTMPLKPGAYSVMANIGLLEQRHTVQVEKQGASVLDVVFDAGRVRLSDGARLSPTASSASLGEASSIVTLQRVSPAGSSGLAKADGSKAVRAVIVVAAGGVSDVVLQTGKYLLTTQKGHARSEQSIEIVAGERLDVALTPGTGELKLELELGLATEPGSTSASGVLYKILIDDPETRLGRREIARSTARFPSFTLPAGTYYVSAQVGLATSKARVAVGAGKSTTANLKLPAALLNLQTNLVISGRPSNLRVQYRIFHLGSGEQQVAQSSKQNPVFILAPGKYRIVAEIGARNVTAKAEVDLPNGSKTDVKLNPRAGAVVLNLAGEASTATVSRFWVVRDQSGVVVWRSNAYAPSALLAPGVYEVTCETRNGELKRAFELAAGENKSVDLSSQ